MGSPKLGRWDARCSVLHPSVSRLLIVHSNLKGSFSNSICAVQALAFSSSTTRCGANGRVMGIAWLEGRTAPAGAVLLLAPGFFTRHVLRSNGRPHQINQISMCPFGKELGSCGALVVLEPDVAPAVRKTHNRSLITTAATLPEKVCFGFLQKNRQSLIRHH